MEEKNKYNTNHLVAAVLIGLIIGGIVVGISMEENVNTAYQNGLLYTQQTGNIMFRINNQLIELTIPSEWKTQIQQKLNITGGQ